MGLLVSQNELEEIWNKIPWDILPLSAKVDFCLFIARIKPALRTQVKEGKKSQHSLNSIRDLGYHSILDENGFLVISRDTHLSKTIIEVDQSRIPHAATLGVLLGYPSCCTKFIEKVGESSIDRVAEEYKKDNFRGLFSLLDISQYLKGIALISHVPCSYKCKPSLTKALFIRSFIKSNKNVRGFAEWASLLNEYFKISRDLSK